MPHSRAAPPRSQEPEDAGGTTLPALRTTKKLRRGQPGARQRLARHGDALACVRFPQDSRQLYRYATIEPVMRAGPVHSTRFDAASFGIRLRHHEHELRCVVRDTDACPDPVVRPWWMRA